jgi:hypothetical protein
MHLRNVSVPVRGGHCRFSPLDPAITQSHGAPSDAAICAGAFPVAGHKVFGVKSNYGTAKGVSQLTGSQARLPLRRNPRFL